jgi:hypothetical protein
MHRLNSKLDCHAMASLILHLERQTCKIYSYEAYAKLDPRQTSQKSLTTWFVCFAPRSLLEKSQWYAAINLFRSDDSRYNLLQEDSPITFVNLVTRQIFLNERRLEP